MSFCRKSLISIAITSFLAIPYTALAACPDKGQGGMLAYLGGDVTVEEEVASAGFTSELGLYSAPLSSSGIDLSLVTPAGTPFIMYNWNRNQTILGQPFPYTVKFNPEDFGISVGPIDLGMYVTNTGYTYFMGDGSANPDGIEHAIITDLGGGMFRVGFEDIYNGGDCDFNDNQFKFSGGISGGALNKVLTSGPDIDGIDGIDLVVTVGSPTTVEYDFTIIYTGEDRVLVVDTVPAEWTGLELSWDVGDADQAPAGKGPKSKSATRITWDVAEPGTLKVDADTRPSPGGNAKFAPTSCGMLSLNDGAVALQVDQVTGELILDDDLKPIVVYGPTDGINLMAVGDEDTGVLPADYPRDGTGDYDVDGLTDAMEVFNIGSDPCLVDTDGDGVNDFFDACPLEGPADPVLGEIGEPDGCNRQSQCSDRIDNDADGDVDFPVDTGCDDILDDREASAESCDAFVCGDGPCDTDTGGDDCYCFATNPEITEGICVDDFFCAGAEDCSADAGICAPLGKVCFYQTCCGAAFCGSAECTGVIQSANDVMSLVPGQTAAGL